MTRIIVVDDHPIVREGLVSALDGKNGIEVAGVFGSADDALRARARAEVVLLDLELPGLGGIDAISRFDAPVLILTAYDAEEDVDRAMAAGAKGYLLKGAPLAEIERAIAAVAAGGSFIDARVIRSRVRLSPREREVLQRLAAGDSNKEIARKLAISERTVKFHVTSIFTKLGAENRAGAVAIAAERRLI